VNGFPAYCPKLLDNALALDGLASDGISSKTLCENDFAIGNAQQAEAAIDINRRLTLIEVWAIRSMSVVGMLRQQSQGKVLFAQTEC
jgi:hypothetical protein